MILIEKTIGNAHRAPPERARRTRDEDSGVSPKIAASWLGFRASRTPARRDGPSRTQAPRDRRVTSLRTTVARLTLAGSTASLASFFRSAGLQRRRQLQPQRPFADVSASLSLTGAPEKGIFLDPRRHRLSPLPQFRGLLNQTFFSRLNLFEAAADFSHGVLRAVPARQESNLAGWFRFLGLFSTQRSGDLTADGLNRAAGCLVG
ncbi:hypothetical protein ABIF69_010127 [Bradyrhizobium japonicum]